MAEKLKPCPFCGHKPILERWASGGTMFMVKCNNPDCPVPLNSYPAGRNIDDVNGISKDGCLIIKRKSYRNLKPNVTIGCVKAVFPEQSA